MAVMYPKNLSEYMPTASEQLVYEELKKQLPDSFSVFYSVTWSTVKNQQMEKSEADFIVTSPDFGYLCLEVKGGSNLRIEDNKWYVGDSQHGERELPRSPYEQAEQSMYYFKELYSITYHTSYQGTYAAGAVFPFYSIDNIQVLSNRNRACTIDASDMDRIYDKIKEMFKTWGGASYGRKVYGRSQHNAFMELVRKRLAISAAAGALIRYKEKQLDVINRVQDNYIYFLTNVNQFYIRGGAGTGKTWIAMKMAGLEAEKGKKTLFLCASRPLAEWVGRTASEQVETQCMEEILRTIAENFDSFQAPLYAGISQSIKKNLPKYDAVLIDEAQDFTEEWAYIVKLLLRDEKTSRLGVFYDDIQVIREESFGDAFMIQTPPFLLRENIRNTSNIYSWAMEKTSLGADVIVNPVEGPTPSSENINDLKHLTHRLENLFKEYLEDEKLKNSTLAVLVEDADRFMDAFDGELAKWKFTKALSGAEDEILVSSVEEFKGLEANMVIYIHRNSTTDRLNYIAYTRAKYYLQELIIK